MSPLSSNGNSDPPSESWVAALVRPPGASAEFTALIGRAETTIRSVYTRLGNGNHPVPDYREPIPVANPGDDGSVHPAYGPRLDEIGRMTRYLNTQDKLLQRYIMAASVTTDYAKEQIKSTTALLSDKLAAVGSGAIAPAVHSSLIESIGATVHAIHDHAESVADQNASTTSRIDKLINPTVLVQDAR